MKYGIAAAMFAGFVLALGLLGMGFLASILLVESLFTGHAAVLGFDLAGVSFAVAAVLVTAALFNDVNLIGEEDEVTP